MKMRRQPQKDSAPSEKHARRRACEILWAPGSLPRDLDEWLHTERELLAGKNFRLAPANRTKRRVIEARPPSP